MTPLTEVPGHIFDYARLADPYFGNMGSRERSIVLVAINADRTGPIASPPISPVCKKFQAADEILAVARSSTMSDCDMALVQCLTRLLAELRKEG